MIKAVVLERRQGDVALKRVALAATPPKAVTAGVLTDSIGVARALKSLWNDYGITETRIAAAVAGERVICQADVADSTDRRDIDGFVENRVRKELLSDATSCCWGYEVRQEPREGAVVWLSADSAGVDWIRDTAGLAGATPVLIEGQSSALMNAYVFNYEPGPTDVALLLHLGARFLTVVLLLGGTPLAGRDVALSKDWSAADEPAPVRAARALEQLKPRLETRLGGYGLGALHSVPRVYVSGGPARSAETIDRLRPKFSGEIEEFDAFRRISYVQASESGQVVREHGPALAVAAGLALQGIADL
jgi:Tfp pilus assembly PilM family ATPase